MKRINKTIITSTIMLLLLSSFVYSATIYDMQKVNLNVEKPKAEFSIEYETSDGRSGDVTSNSKYYDSDIYSFDQSPTAIKVPVGTKINFVDSSVSGAGSRIVAYDFQVYTPSESKLYYLDSLSEAPSMILNEEGKYEFYLCVMDNYQRVNGYDNWSVNGNHRWLTKRQDNSLDKFWWYFTQVNVNVYGVDEDNPENPEEPIIEEPEIDEPEVINHNPELYVIKPDKYYPVEITDKGIKTNTVKWTYFDEDGDDFDHGAYELYKKEGSSKVLISSDSFISNEDNLRVLIEGEMGDSFKLNMYVYDSEGNWSMKGIDITILTISPSIQIINKDRTYLDDDLDIELKRLDSDLAEYIDINYDSYEVLDEDGKIVVSGKGSLPSKLYLKEKYEEDRSYELYQKILTSDKSLKTFESRFYIVPILEPLVSLEMINGYIGETKETGLIVTQKQSPLRGTLPEYIYNFTDEDGYYEIYYGNTLKFKSKGLCYQIELDDRFEPGRTYKLIQYVTNGAGKIGKGTTNIQIKEVEENKLSLSIVERDNNPLTPFDEIYPKEKIYLKANLKSLNKVISRKSWIENENGVKVYEDDSLFNGLVQIHELGKYKAFSKVSLENGDELTADVNFIVKEIQKPIITHDIVKYNYLRGDAFTPNMLAKDINMSEEHPFGYALKTLYEWNDKTKDGLFKSENLSNYENKRKYLLIQKAFNSEFEDINSKEEIEISLDNLSPTIESEDYYECSCGEEIEIKAIAYDKDGIITSFISDFENEIKTKDEHTKEMTLKFKSDKEEIYKFQLSCTDDSGDTDLKNISIKVSNNKEYPFIKILNYEKDRLKENRYIQIEFGNIFNLDNHFEINGLEIGDDINNSDYHLIYEKDERNDSIVGMYFKHPGKFIISNSIVVNNQEIERTLTLEICEDKLPQITLSSDKEIVRSPDTKSAESNVRYEYFTDDEISKIEILKEGKLYNTYYPGETVNVDFGYNILGEKEIHAKIFETHNYLPEKTNVLYNELINLMKINESQKIYINIVNVKPDLNFSVKNNNQIRILK